ncbi:TPM domain-containing protein [Pontiellaceae bacterium B12227]|nr:TPM domain-containing protein [Pontiellaceae bacterium B12227]
MRKQVQVYLLLFACAVSALASDAFLNRLEPRGYVNDFAYILSEADEQRINRVIVELNQKTGAEIAVVTLKTLAGRDIDDFTNRLFEKWGVGQEGKDNGLMFLCAMQDRKMRIEVGYGLEGIISDSKAGRIRRDIITPHFKAGNPAAGILAGVRALSDVVEGKSLNLPVSREPVKNSGSGWGWLLLFTFFGLIGLIAYIDHKRGGGMKAVRRGRYTWDGHYRQGPGSGSGGFGGGGGFSGGGFGGFSGGCSGGGGSSGGW